MNAHTSVQIIGHNVKPTFSIIPYIECLNLTLQDDNEYIPNEVVELMVKKRYNSVKAWRVYLNLTKKEVVKRAEISRVALSQIEKTENEFRSVTLEKLADAMNLSVDQLTD